MLSVEDALQRVIEVARPLPAITLPLLSAAGHVLAEDVTSDVDSPPHDKAIVDGYAVVADELRGGSAELVILEEVVAGALPTRAVASGFASRVMTGAPIPQGADAMIMVERSRVITGSGDLGRVQLKVDNVSAGMNIMRRATSMRRGDTVLAKGAKLRAIEIGILAEVGRAEVSVIARPNVAVLATGDELVDAAETPGPGQIRNSNGPLLVTTLASVGAEPIDLGIGRDNRDSLVEKISAGLAADVLLLSGGVSAGVLDLVPGVLCELGVREIFHKVSLKPGKPLWFGVHSTGAHNCLVFGLPGNPVSSLVGFELFVRPAINQLAGRGPIGLTEVTGRLAVRHLQRGDRLTLLPARARLVESGYEITLLDWRGSADLRTLEQADALAVFPAGDGEFAAGAPIRAYLLESRR